MRRRPAWLGVPGKDADGAVLLTGPEAGELLKAAVEHAGGGLVDWHLDHVDANPGQSTTATYQARVCLLYTSPSPRDQRGSRMPSSA